MKHAIVVITAASLAAACAGMQVGGPAARADLAPTQGNTARGTVTFTKAGDKVRVVAKMSGLAPGQHGFHVHEKGDCSAADATSAGGHFNPAGKPHGHHSSAERHAGDMPSLVADASGNAELSVTLDLLSVGSGAADVIGKSVVVHKDPDDYTSQPAGNSGARVACGVVRAS